MAFPARYRGTCTRCEGPIKVGQMITTEDGEEFRHDLVCPEDDTMSAIDLRPGEKVCPSCHLVHPKGDC